MTIAENITEVTAEKEIETASSMGVLVKARIQRRIDELAEMIESREARIIELHDEISNLESRRDELQHAIDLEKQLSLPISPAQVETQTPAAFTPPAPPIATNGNRKGQRYHPGDEIMDGLIYTTEDLCDVLGEKYRKLISRARGKELKCEPFNRGKGKGQGFLFAGADVKKWWASVPAAVKESPNKRAGSKKKRARPRVTNHGPISNPKKRV